MIFASDLDQTLIYSENFLGKHYNSSGQIKSEILNIIEYYQGKPLSYIHRDVLKLLQEFTVQHYFVPVTTRTEEQYKRIRFREKQITPRYAITTNGAKILIEGEPDSEWAAIVQAKLQQCTLTTREIRALLKKHFREDQILKIREAEGVFVYCILDMDRTPLEQINSVRNYFSIDEWNLSLQGRKLYIMPEFISKGQAMNYVCDRIGEDRFVAAGDSLLDLSLLEKAVVGFIPAHGEIYNQNLYGQLGLIACTKEGVYASKEILENVLEVQKI